MRMYPQTLCPIILLLVFVQTSTTTTISVDSDSSSTQLMLLSLARIEAALSRVDTLDLQSVEMAQKLDENFRELGLLDSKVTKISNSLVTGVKADAADRFDVVQLGQSINAFRAAEANEDIGDVIEQQEQTRLVAMAIDARRRLTVDVNKQTEAEWVINLDWYFRTTVMAMAMLFFMYYNKAIIQWLRFSFAGASEFSFALRSSRTGWQPQKGNGEDRAAVGGRRERDRHAPRDDDRAGRGTKKRGNDTSHSTIMPARASSMHFNVSHHARQMSEEELIFENNDETLDAKVEGVYLLGKEGAIEDVRRAGNLHQEQYQRSSHDRDPFRQVSSPSGHKSVSKYALKWITKAHVGGKNDFIKKSDAGRN